MKKLWLRILSIENEERSAYIQRSLAENRGIEECAVDIKSKKVLIYFDPRTANLAQVRQILEEAGFRAEPIIQPMI